MKFDEIKPFLPVFKNDIAEVPMSFQAAAVRYAARGRGLDTSYLEVQRPAKGIAYRLIWITEHAFGVLTGTSPDQRWTGGQSLSDEPDHSIVGQVYPLSAIRSVSFTDTAAGYDDSDKEISVVGEVTIHVHDADIKIGSKHLTSDELRERRDAVIDAVLDAVGRSS